MQSFLQTLIFLSLVITIHGQSWTKIQDYPGTGRDDGAVFVINNKAYCFSGVITFFGQFQGDGYILDASTETWSNMASLPAGKERQYATAFSDGTNGYVLGGFDTSYNCLNDFWQYTVATDTWLSLPNFPGAGRQGMSSFVLNNKVYIVGGRLNGNVTSNEVWEYNFTNAIWTQKNNLPFTGLWRGACFTIGNNGYVGYGKTNAVQFNHFIYRYDAINDTWTKISNLVLPSRTYVGTAVCNNNACLYGGQDSIVNFVNDFVVFNPNDSSLISYSGIPALPRKGGMAFSMNGVFYYTTGFDVNYFRTKDTWKYDGFTNLNDLENNQGLTIYPNPVSDWLTIIGIDKSKNDFTIDIFDVLGRQKLSNIRISRLDVSVLNSGTYYLKVKSGTQIIACMRFIKI
jgi:Secretion system C-terminal sorting domain/Kelch motif